MKQTKENEILKYNSMFLGVFMFLFGFLKLFEPFRTMFDVQITKSGLPRFSIPMGKAGEMSIGLGLLLASCFRQRIPNLYTPIVFVASAGLIVNMGIASYVHLRPEVPANVLPLGIKPPFIPLFVMFLAAVNLYQLYRGRKRRSLRPI
ncbi:hypothetical protein [Mycobacterium sp. Aquia_213]|uniref:hypothetical protein n=1 Tax=Mycobacterium sp. Aquia_213 TaxID=2991728 RepID=UPI0022703605|nr:hypothetical protein [Mycobacterium sp. Aquia_213]WAC92215.1 hypothetical protein LMQ14_03120 [Mycobacterium sp. Aquia_213]